MILAIDTATDWVGVALYDGAEMRAEQVWRGGRYHTASVAPEVALLMRRAGVAQEELTGVGVAQGPGSYTGLRIGMALAKGLAMARGIPLVGVPTLDVLAYAQPPRPEPMLAVIQAGRRRIAGVWYKWEKDTWRRQTEPETMTWAQLLERLEGPTYICGEVEEAARQALSRDRRVRLASPAFSLRRPGFLAELALLRLKAGETGDPARVVPTYLGSAQGDEGP